MDTLTAWDAFIGQYVTIPRAGYVLIAFAIFLLGVVACKLFRDRDLARFGETTTGTVVRVSEETDVDHAIVHFVRFRGKGQRVSIRFAEAKRKHCDRNIGYGSVRPIQPKTRATHR